MTTKEYEEKLKRIRYKNKQKEMKARLEKEEDKYKKKFKWPSTTKLIATYLFVIFNVVLVFVMYAMWHFADLSYLGVLITDIAAQVLVFLIYCIKSAKENSKNGIVYDKAMAELNASLNANQNYSSTIISSTSQTTNDTYETGSSNAVG